MCNTCPHCGSILAKYTVHISRIHVEILIKILDYCLRQNIFEFTIKELDEALKLSKTEYGNLNVLCRFGLLYRKTDDEGRKIKGGYYGINRGTARDFLLKKWKVARDYTRDVAHKTHTLSEERIFVDEIKGAQEFLTEKNIPAYVNYISS